MYSRLIAIIIILFSLLAVAGPTLQETPEVNFFKFLVGETFGERAEVAVIKACADFTAKCILISVEEEAAAFFPQMNRVPLKVKISDKYIEPFLFESADETRPLLIPTSLILAANSEDSNLREQTQSR